ncbi:MULTISPECIES: phosphonate C-P lyase system protein PhnG [unclassified Rhizobium]|uniref:phosphonate C-P lyase system protein PhnG n=1 Tax=unclassified Rhizobium TaxID=2613769 RepID=UPI0006468D65|nr:MULTISPECIES: phosphonate C-P lyase system protein PhnG [unclassified Rhizobium]MBN8953168.1 phosphonate C-P lyase system protein PhnG [Rhizobium tropici]OJY75712.1 MAG: phosphonate C-P lyase system protein PhnG [Rhizobium sp. 60-20]RKD75073.1 alpha-D-ribose 1-methylphosphonate 5-triphosphate synthase subunit PhnG [Rhizobium sp. WW_1]
MNSAQRQEAAAQERRERKRVADLLAQTERDELEAAWEALPSKPVVQPVRGPETGLVMVRGRIGGGGSPFNLGEVTVTRATIRLASNTIGHAHALGTDREKARLSAIFDALWQQPATRDFVEKAVLQPVTQRIADYDRKRAEETAATRVDFFTMVRGED